MTEIHPFAKYIGIIGRGPRLSRPLTEDEMLGAARMIMKGEVEPLQLGALLCILRMRAEVPAEGAGFVKAARETFTIPENAPAVDLDWATYSGKVRHLPWFLLSALVLSQNGVKICMQGTEGHTEGRVFSSEALTHMGIPMAGSMQEAADQIRDTNFAYLPLRNFCKPLQDIIDLKSILGLRTPVNTFARMLNPFQAPHEIQNVFHPAYRDIHRDTAQLLGQPHMAVFKGEGGEIERRPQKPVLVESLRAGEKWDEHWPALLGDAGQHRTDDDLNLDRLVWTWQGKEESEYAHAAITGTLAVALRLLGRADGVDDALNKARDMWAARNKSFF
ncbi:MAG: glycosyl transferase [Rhodospirillaceae bacterium]|nr:MAG: glycosyl transferase [Rhodospirillaceae bacterium]